MSDVPKDIADIAKRLSARAISKNLSPIDTVEWVVQQAIMEERGRCAGIAKEIAYGEGTDFGSVNAILYGWPKIGECQHGKMAGENCAECPKEAREKWWLKEPME